MSMPYFICKTCGTQFDETPHPPTACAICLDERQYVGQQGQQWTTIEKLSQSHWQTIRQKETHLIGIGIAPKFGIGQRALLIRSTSGNILWDCVSLIDSSLIAMISAMGGLSAIAISHPHYYTTMIEWSRVFNCPVYVHEADRQWVMRSDQAINFWTGDSMKIGEQVTLLRCGGHFTGGTVLHWAEGCDGQGALLSGDIIQVVQDRNWVSFMYSYPNFIPLSAAKVKKIVQTVEPYCFDRIYGAFWNWVVENNAKEVVRQSAKRYIERIEEEE